METALIWFSSIITLFVIITVCLLVQLYNLFSHIHTMIQNLEHTINRRNIETNNIVNLEPVTLRLKKIIQRMRRIYPYN
jgi:predicted PurR-regulated permease PerM